jgi:hypothetical protein
MVVLGVGGEVSGTTEPPIFLKTNQKTNHRSNRTLYLPSRKIKIIGIIPYQRLNYYLRKYGRKEDHEECLN